MKPPTLTVTLEDQMDDHHVLLRGRTVQVTVKVNERGIEIYPEGYGEQSATKGHGCPILIELADDKLRAVLWTDINYPDPLIVSLEGARDHLKK